MKILLVLLLAVSFSAQASDTAARAKRHDKFLDYKICRIKHIISFSKKGAAPADSIAASIARCTRERDEYAAAITDEQTTEDNQRYGNIAKDIILGMEERLRPEFLAEAIEAMPAPKK